MKSFLFLTLGQVAIARSIFAGHGEVFLSNVADMEPTKTTNIKRQSFSGSGPPVGDPYNPVSIHGCVPRDTVINPSFNHNFDNWTVLEAPSATVSPFPWQVVTGGYADNQVVYAQDDTTKASDLRSAQWKATTPGVSSLSGAAIGELWQWVPVCHDLKYGFNAWFYSTDTTNDCSVYLNISGIASEPVSWSTSNSSWTLLYSEVESSKDADAMLIGIQFYCNADGVTNGAKAQIDSIQLSPLAFSHDHGGYIPINGPNEDDPSYQWYGNYNTD